MSDLFETLRAQLRVPYREEPYHLALERAEAEAVATREAARVMLDAAIETGGIHSIRETLFWAAEAYEAKRRLERVRDRKRSAPRCCCTPTGKPPANGKHGDHCPAKV